MSDPSISERARDALEAGQRGLAESICRLQLYSGVEGEAARRAWELLAKIARGVGRGDVEAAYLARARGEEKSFPPTSSLNEGESEKHSSPVAAREPTPQPPPSGRGSVERLLLIRAWGQGFFADVDHVLGQCLLAEITGRTPLVFWGAESRFGDRGLSNAWERYFEPVSSVNVERTIADASNGRVGITFFPERWNATNLRSVHLPLLDAPETRIAPADVLGRPEDVVVSTMHGSMAMILPWTHAHHPLHASSVGGAFAAVARKYLRPNTRVLTFAKSAHEDLFASHQRSGGRVLAIHLRGCDKEGEDPKVAVHRETVIAKAGALLDGPAGSSWRLLVLTDFEPMVAACRVRFGDRAIFTRAQRSSGQIGLHFDRTRDGPQLGDEVLTDVLLAIRCDRFIGIGSSNVSTAVSYLKDWGDNCELLGERYFERVNPMIYLR